MEIAVLEGRYGKLDLRNSSRLSDSLARDTLSSASSGAVIEQSRLERELLLLKDLAGVASAATLKPGEQVGTSDLVVDITPTRTFTGTLEADNYGNRYTGQAAPRRQRCRSQPRGARRSAFRPRAGYRRNRTLVRSRRVSDTGDGQRTQARRRVLSYLLHARPAVHRPRCERRREYLHPVRRYPAIRSTRGNLDAQASVQLPRPSTIR